MRIFRSRVEIAAKNAAPGLALAIRTAFECEVQADGRGNGRIGKAQRPQAAMICRKDQEIKGPSAGKRGATRRGGRPCQENVRIA